MYSSRKIIRCVHYGWFVWFLVLVCMQSIFLRNNCKKLNSSRCIPGKWWTANRWCDRQTHWQNIVFTFLPFLFAIINQKRTLIFFDFHFSWFIQGIASETKVLVKVVQCIICQQIIFLKFFFLFIIIYCSRMRKSHRTESTTRNPEKNLGDK